MKHSRHKFSSASVDYYFNSSFVQLKRIVDQKHAVIITDANIYKAHKKKFSGWNTIVLKPGEEFKIQATVDNVIDQLIDFRADRSTVLIGVGGGVVTDITGYIASVFLRGVRFGFVPTSLLAMVDACIGGKNGIDVGVYKNIVGIIRQPAFLLYDMGFLKTLPRSHWENGFAEIIKHACIKDEKMFTQLEQSSFETFTSNTNALVDIVEKNVLIKTKFVQRDEFEKGERRLLNFGHTLGHALENQYELLHGHAVSIGMTYASVISEKLTGFKASDRIISLLSQYNLPSWAGFETDKVFDTMRMDKKRVKKILNFVVLEKIGRAVVVPIPIHKLESIINRIKQ